jgi:hypothetical protein
MHIDLESGDCIPVVGKKSVLPNVRRWSRKKKPRASPLFFSYGHGWSSWANRIRRVTLLPPYSTNFDLHILVLSLLSIYSHSIVVSIVARLLVDIARKSPEYHVAIQPLPTPATSMRQIKMLQFRDRTQIAVWQPTWHLLTFTQPRYQELKMKFW